VLSQLRPVGDPSATALSGEFGQHTDQQDLGQRILESSLLSPILDLP